MNYDSTKNNGSIFSSRDIAFNVIPKLNAAGRIDDAKFISDRFYSQHYFDEEKSNELNNDKLEESDSLDNYLDKNLDDSIEDSKNEKSKQISFDDF